MPQLGNQYLEPVEEESDRLDKPKTDSGIQKTHAHISKNHEVLELEKKLAERKAEIAQDEKQEVLELEKKLAEKKAEIAQDEINKASPIDKEKNDHL